MLFVKQLALIALVATAGNVSAGRRGYVTLAPSSPRQFTSRSSSGNYFTAAASSNYPVQQKIEESDAIEQRPIQQQREQPQQQQQQQYDSQGEEELNNLEDSVAQQGNYASYRAGYSASYGHRFNPAPRPQPTTTPAPKDFGENLPEELPAQELLAGPPAPPRKPKPQLQLFPTEQKPQQSSEPPATGEEQAKFVDFQHIKYGEIPLTQSFQDYAPPAQNYAPQKQQQQSSSYGNSFNNNNFPSISFGPQQSEWKPKKSSGYGLGTGSSFSQKIMKDFGTGSDSAYNSYSTPSFGGYNDAHSSYGGQRYNGENIKAAVQTYQTIEYKEVPIEQGELKPIMIEIPASENTVSLHFKSRSSQLNIRQNHESGKGTVQETSSEDEPQILRHIVTKPIYQEIREIIKPMRKITQEIRPVKEQIQTIVAKADKSKSKASQGYSTSSDSGATESYADQPIQQEEQIKEQTNYDNGVDVTAFSVSTTESSIQQQTTQDLSGFDDNVSTESSISTQTQPSVYSGSRSYSSGGSYSAPKTSSAALSYGARKPTSSPSYGSQKPVSSSYAPQKPASSAFKGQNIPIRSKPIGGSIPFARMTFTMGSSPKKQNLFAQSFGTGGALPPKPSRNPLRQNSVLGRSAALFENEEAHRDEPESAVTPAPRQRFVPSAAPGSSDHEIIEDELENAELHVPLPESLQGAASGRSYRKALKATYKARRSRNVPKRRVYRTTIN